MIRLDEYWYSQNPVAWLLLPVSWLFCLVATLRRVLYRGGILKSIAAPVPVIVVGNITVGGTGKTPLIIALSDLLEKQGLKAGIVSRGYGGSLNGVKIVSTDDDPALVGDEPCLLKRRTGLPVAVGADRPAAVSRLLAAQHCDVILSDDGLQHYRLQRDLEIAVVDADRKFGNGFCLPAGPLRELPGRLATVDIIAWHHSPGRDIESSEAYTLEFEDAVHLVSGETRAIASFSDAPVHAVAGIGNPGRFFAQLEMAGLSVIGHGHPDHHVFTPGELMFDDGHHVLMTEKDAVKCGGIAHERCWYVPVSARLSQRLAGMFLSEVRRVTDSNPHA